MTKIIDGRKAEIVNAGKLYTTYNEFAVKHGYPEAAAESDWSDSRKRPPLKGDIVTLLTSSTHIARRGVSLWIVEAENGERHIISEDGLRIMVAEPAPTTLLPDESLGGTLREYREVKREASVGETVVMTEATGTTMKYGREVPDYHNGDTFVIERITSGIATSTSGKLFYHREYSVLEPTDTLVINSERFRMVDRKAAVGERVIVTENKSSGRRFKVGEVYTVICVDDYEDRNVIVKHPEGMHSPSGGARLFDYAVLEPVESAAPTLLSDQPAEAQAAANIVSLALKVAELEKRNTTLEGRILALETDSAPACVKVASGPVDTALPTFASLGVMKSAAVKEAALSPQEIRAEIVERAKADLENVKTPWNISADPQPLVYTYNMRVVDVEFIVNRDKRTVVAILRWRYNGAIQSRGIAKAAPGDVFNSHIGRAIALRRALGLEVPAEYLTCPQPTEIRVGDVILWTSSYDASDTEVLTIASVVSGGYQFVGGEWDGFETVRVIDDSREDGGISASPSALKGAA